MTDYGLDDRRVGVRVPIKSRMFTSPCRPNRLWNQLSLLSNGCGGKAALEWSWPFTSDISEVKKTWIYTSAPNTFSWRSV
jgi:hypothetical protein